MLAFLRGGPHGVPNKAAPTDGGTILGTQQLMNIQRAKKKKPSVPQGKQRRLTKMISPTDIVIFYSFTS